MIISASPILLLRSFKNLGAGLGNLSTLGPQNKFHVFTISKANEPTLKNTTKMEPECYNYRKPSSTTVVNCALLLSKFLLFLYHRF